MFPLNSIPLAGFIVASFSSIFSLQTKQENTQHITLLSPFSTSAKMTDHLFKHSTWISFRQSFDSYANFSKVAGTKRRRRRNLTWNRVRSSFLTLALPLTHTFSRVPSSRYTSFLRSHFTWVHRKFGIFHKFPVIHFLVVTVVVVVCLLLDGTRSFPSVSRGWLDKRVQIP